MSRVELVHASSTDLMDTIAYIARVSNPAGQNNKKTGERLIRYMIREGHWSPFEMVNICLEIETTRDIARQILTFMKSGGRNKKMLGWPQTMHIRGL